MLGLLAGAGLAFLEREMVNIEPKMQQAIVDELKKVSDSLVGYINYKMREEEKKIQDKMEQL